MQTLFRLLSLCLVLGCAWLFWLILASVELPKPGYTLKVGPNCTMGQVARVLEEDGVVSSRRVMVVLARLKGVDRKIRAGVYRLEDRVSILYILNRLAEGRPDESSLMVIEGWTFRQFRQAIDRHPDIKHITQGWSDGEVIRRLGCGDTKPEGLFFPSTYLFSPGTEDTELYKKIFTTMQQKLKAVWTKRKSALPYRTPYELLIMASLIEKETGRDVDRPMVAGVLVNRLRLGMRLQTDPSVIYGMGGSYKSKLTKADLRRDTPYNTYTRAGLTPTPIALPGKASLEAAATPAETNALYFVARGDGSSHFSTTLYEHNQAVQKFILKKDK